MVFSIGVGALLAVALQSPSGMRMPRTQPSDTVDVIAGAGILDFSKHAAGQVRATQTSSPSGPSGETIWTFTFTDTGGRSLVHVSSETRSGRGGGPGTGVTVLDRKTMALRAWRVGNPANPFAEVVVDDSHVKGKMNVPGAGLQAVDTTLQSPPFMSGLQDLLVESLPRKPGVVYRISFWRPGAPTPETRMYVMTRREDITVGTKSYSQAAVYEEYMAADKSHRSTMWVIDEAPYLVHWVVNVPNGTTLTLDQEVYRSP